jgi:opacity protein-like surface antigen
MMKNLLTSLILFILLSGAVMAQSIYIRAGGGFGFPIATSPIGEKYLHTEVYDGVNTTNNYSTEGVTGSYGSGINFNFAVGYKFNENFIFELNTQYLISNKYKTGDNYSYTGVGNSSVDNNNTTTSARALFLNPSFVFSAGFGKAAPYGRFGFIIGSPKVTGKESTYYNGDGIDSTEKSWEFTKGLSLGFQGAVGMNWKLTEKLDFYTEVNFISMTYYPGEYNVTRDISSNGYNLTDNLPNMPLGQKQTIYKKKYDPNTPYDSAKPSIALREAKPFSSLSLQVGIRFSLWKKVE